MRDKEGFWMAVILAILVTLAGGAMLEGTKTLFVAMPFARPIMVFSIAIFDIAMLMRVSKCR